MSRHIQQFVTTPRILILVAGALLTCALAATSTPRPERACS